MLFLKFISCFEREFFKNFSTIKTLLYILENVETSSHYINESEFGNRIFLKK